MRFSMSTTRLLASLFVISIATPALAQTTAPTDDPDAIIEELVVTARYPGPAYWRVSDADSEVWILGIPARVPSKLAWDRTRTEQIMKGANALILPSVATAGLGEIIGFTLKNLNSFTNENDRTLEQVLPASVAENYRALPPEVRRDNLLKSKYKPVFSGFMLQAATYKAQDWTTMERELIRLAKAARVKTRHASVTPVLPMATAMMSQTETEQAQCFDAFVTDVSLGIKTVAPMAKAWADGRPSVLLQGSTTSGIEDCLFTVAEIKNKRELAYESEIKTIKAALDQPGKTLMVAKMRPLVTQNGILARLKAEGLTVRTPAD